MSDFSRFVEWMRAESVHSKGRQKKYVFWNRISQYLLPKVREPNCGNMGTEDCRAPRCYIFTTWLFIVDLIKIGKLLDWIRPETSDHDEMVVSL